LSNSLPGYELQVQKQRKEYIFSAPGLFKQTPATDLIYDGENAD
jgi:hypothetical protein